MLWLLGVNISSMECFDLLCMAECRGSSNVSWFSGMDWIIAEGYEYVMNVFFSRSQSIANLNLLIVSYYWISNKWIKLVKCRHLSNILAGLTIYLYNIHALYVNIRTPESQLFSWDIEECRGISQYLAFLVKPQVLRPHIPLQCRTNGADILLTIILILFLFQAHVFTNL